MKTSKIDIPGVKINGAVSKGYEAILTPEAIEFVVALHRSFNKKRKQLLQAREVRQKAIAAGELPDFLGSTKKIRDGNWQVAPIPADLQDRRTEMSINCKILMKLGKW